MKPTSLIPPLKRVEPPSKFDRHYNTRLNKRWRDISLILAGLTLLILIIVAIDPLLSGGPTRLGTLSLFAFLFFVFVAFAMTFHLRYKSRE